MRVNRFLQNTQIPADAPVLGGLEKIATTLAVYCPYNEETQKINIHIKSDGLLPYEDFMEFDEFNRVRPVDGYIFCSNDFGEFAARIENCYMQCVPYSVFECGYGMPSADNRGLVPCDHPDAYTVDADGKILLLVNWIW